MALSETFYKRLIIIVSVVIPVVVAILFNSNITNIDLNAHKETFGGFHALLNSSVTVLLLAGLLFIKLKNITAHKACMFISLLLSTVFLVSYVVMHATTDSTPYPEGAPYRSVYLIILLTHIVLAAGVLPFILFTFFRALNGQFDRHKKLARITLPLWLYVTITGVVVYFMISPYY